MVKITIIIVCVFLLIIFKKLNLFSFFKKNVSEIIEEISIVEPTIEMPKSEQIAFWNDYIKDYPNRAIGYNERGNLYRHLKEWELAIEDYDKSIEIYPDYSASYLSRGLTWAKLNEKEKAREDLKTAAQLMKQQNNLVGYESVMLFLKDLENGII